MDLKKIHNQSLLITVIRTQQGEELHSWFEIHWGADFLWKIKFDFELKNRNILKDNDWLQQEIRERIETEIWIWNKKFEWKTNNLEIWMKDEESQHTNINDRTY